MELALVNKTIKSVLYVCGGYYLLLAYVPPFSHFISPTFLHDQGRKHENVDYL